MCFPEHSFHFSNLNLIHPQIPIITYVIGGERSGRQTFYLQTYCSRPQNLLTPGALFDERYGGNNKNIAVIYNFIEDPC